MLHDSSVSGYNFDMSNLQDKTIITKEIPHNSIKQAKNQRESKIFSKTLNISTPIAMFITAYARMHMAKFKIRYADNLYYTDTDSLVLDVELPNNIISNELGHFKLEHKIKKGIFIAPKVYGLLLEDTGNGETEIIKVKGSKIKIPFKDLDALLFKDKISELVQERWYKDINAQTIRILETAYTLKVTDNKRVLIYDANYLIDTKPIVI